VLDQAGDVFWIRGVQDVKEVHPVREICFCLLLWEELGQLGLLHHIRDEVDHTQLVVLRYLSGTDLSQRDQMLLACEHKLYEILRKLLLRGKIILSQKKSHSWKCGVTVLRQVRVQIVLAPEPGHEVPGVDASFRLLGLPALLARSSRVLCPR